MRVVDTPTGSLDLVPVGDGVVLHVDEQYSNAPGMASIPLNREQATALAHAILEQVEARPHWKWLRVFCGHCRS